MLLCLGPSVIQGPFPALLELAVERRLKPISLKCTDIFRQEKNEGIGGRSGARRRLGDGSTDDVVGSVVERGQSEPAVMIAELVVKADFRAPRSEEHQSEIQSLMR